MIRALPLLVLTALPAQSDTPVILSADLNGTRLSVTLSHGDTGWDHYADGWQVMTPDGTEIGYRTLHHPHVDEQPFTRSLQITVPERARALHIRPHDSVHGWGEVFVLNLR